MPNHPSSERMRKRAGRDRWRSGSAASLDKSQFQGIDLLKTRWTVPAHTKSHVANIVKCFIPMRRIKHVLLTHQILEAILGDALSPSLKSDSELHWLDWDSQAALRSSVERPFCCDLTPKSPVAIQQGLFSRWNKNLVVYRSKNRIVMPFAESAKRRYSSNRTASKSDPSIIPFRSLWLVEGTNTSPSSAISDNTPDRWIECASIISSPPKSGSKDIRPFPESSFAVQRFPQDRSLIETAAGQHSDLSNRAPYSHQHDRHTLLYANPIVCLRPQISVLEVLKETFSGRQRAREISQPDCSIL